LSVLCRRRQFIYMIYTEKWCWVILCVVFVRLSYQQNYQPSLRLKSCWRSIIIKLHFRFILHLGWQQLKLLINFAKFQNLCQLVPLDFLSPFVQEECICDKVGQIFVEQKRQCSHTLFCYCSILKCFIGIEMQQKLFRNIWPLCYLFVLLSSLLVYIASFFSCRTFLFVMT